MVFSIVDTGPLVLRSEDPGCERWHVTPMARVLKQRARAYKHGLVCEVSKQPRDYRLPLNEVLEQTVSSLCRDPRDKIFGVLSLVDWDPRSPVVPDYSKTPLQVAADAVWSLRLEMVLHACDAVGVMDLCAALELSYRDPNIIEMRDERKCLQCPDLGLKPSSGAKSRFRLGFASARYFRLARRPASLEDVLEAKAWGPDDAEEAALPIATSEHYDPVQSKLEQDALTYGGSDIIRIMVGNDLVAYSAGNTRAGDVLLIGFIDGLHKISLDLILRPSSEEEVKEGRIYEIVSQAISNPYTKAIETLYPPESYVDFRMPPIVLEMDVNDMFAWLCHDYGVDRDMSCGLDAAQTFRWSRLTTRVCLSCFSSFAIICRYRETQFFPPDTQSFLDRLKELDPNLKLVVL